MRDYTQDGRRTVERSIEDRNVLEGFIDALRTEKSGDELLDAVDETEASVDVRYQLMHPYDGENFSRYLTGNEEVAARVDLYAGGGRTESLSGTVTAGAQNIFSPEEVADIVKVGRSDMAAMD